MTARRLTAAWVVPVGRPPIPNGAVLVDALGRIAAVGPDTDVPSPPGTPAEHYTDAAIVPGLVNTHTHLELTGLVSRADPADFFAWITDLRAQKAARTPADFLAAARCGLADCFAAGVTTVADTGDTGSVIEALAGANASGTAYHEVFGPDPDAVAASMESLTARVAQLRRFENPRVRLGVSPHAPYSVSGPLYRAAAAWARREGMPIAVHVAESRAETSLLTDGSGPFAAMWTRRKISLPPGGQSPIAWLDEHEVLGATTLCIHAVQVDAADLSRIRMRGAAVAHCPRSNRAHGHGDAPLARFLAAGIRVGLGTDSVLSTGALDLLQDARIAALNTRLDAAAALNLCTLGAAAALGLETEVGSIEAGKWADLAVFETGMVSDPVATLLECGTRSVRATYVGGRGVYRR